MVAAAIKAAEQASEKVCVVNARFVKPLDKTLLKETAKNAEKVITIEENVIQGGFGSAVAEALNELEIYDKKIKHLGIADNFVEQGSIKQLRELSGLTVENILKIIHAPVLTSVS